MNNGIDHFPDNQGPYHSHKAFKELERERDEAQEFAGKEAHLRDVAERERNEARDRLGWYLDGDHFEYALALILKETERERNEAKATNELLWVAITHITALTHSKKEAAEILDQLQKDINALEVKE